MTPTFRMLLGLLPDEAPMPWPTLRPDPAKGIARGRGPSPARGGVRMRGPAPSRGIARQAPNAR